jgi:ArsR family transcriptional regulator
LIAFIRLDGYIEVMKYLAAIVKSLEEETRLRIMALLLDAEELCVCDFMAVLQLPQSTVSRHLSLLKNAGWLSDRRAGVWIHYSLAKELSPVHTSLVAALRAILIQNKSAGKDRERLSKLNRRTERLS